MSLNRKIIQFALMFIGIKFTEPNKRSSQLCEVGIECIQIHQFSKIWFRHPIFWIRFFMIAKVINLLFDLVMFSATTATDWNHIRNLVTPTRIRRSKIQYLTKNWKDRYKVCLCTPEHNPWKNYDKTEQNFAERDILLNYFNTSCS